MIEYLNPWNHNYPSVGMNPGTATKDWVFAGGMAFDFDTMKRSDKAVTIADETRMCLEEVKAILEAAGSTMKDLVKVTCYVSDDAFRQEVWAAYTEFLGEGPYPSRVTYSVGIAGGCRVELDAIATRPKRA